MIFGWSIHWITFSPPPPPPPPKKKRPYTEIRGKIKFSNFSRFLKNKYENIVIFVVDWWYMSWRYIEGLKIKHYIYVFHIIVKKIKYMKYNNFFLYTLIKNFLLSSSIVHNLHFCINFLQQQQQTAAATTTDSNSNNRQQ